MEAVVTGAMNTWTHRVIIISFMKQPQLVYAIHEK